MKIKQVVLSLCLYATLTPSFASPATDASVDKLMQYANVSNILQQSTHNLQPYFDERAEELVRQFTKTKTLNAGQQNAALQISALFSDLQQKIITDPEFLQLFKTLYKRTFTEEEIQANIAFLSSPLGQSINRKTNILMADAMSESINFVQQKMALPENQKEIKEKIAAILLPLINTH